MGPVSRGLRILGIDAALESPGPAGHPGRTAALLGIAASLGHSATLFVGAAGLRRLHAPLPRRSGIQVVAGSHLEALSGADFDVVILSGEPVATRHVRQVRALMPGAAVIFDAFELGFVRAGQQSAFEGAGRSRLRALEMKQRELSIAQGCDMTWTSSRADERRLTMAAPEITVEVVPPVCDVIRAAPGFDEQAGLVVVGDVREPARRDAESFFLREILPHVRTRHPALSHRLLGIDPVPEQRAVEPFEVPRSELRRRVATARVLVAPFRFSSGLPFEVLQAMADGVPVVTTPVGAEGLDLRHPEAVLVADTTRGLAEHIAAVVGQALLWERLAKGGQEVIARQFSSEAVRPRLQRVLAQLVPDRIRRRACGPTPGLSHQRPLPVGEMAGVTAALWRPGVLDDAHDGESCPAPLPRVENGSGGGPRSRDGGAPEPDAELSTLVGSGLTSFPESAPAEPRPEGHPEPGRTVPVPSVADGSPPVVADGPAPVVADGPAPVVADGPAPVVADGPPSNPRRAGSRPPSSRRASVIVCTHNGSNVIAETLESLVRQDLPPEGFEILVVDNASTDATAEVVEQIAGRHPGRIRLVREPVLGHSSARNRGIGESRGDVIAFTDDDARVSRRWLRGLVEACERPHVGCAGGPVRAVLTGPLPEWVTAPFLPYLALFDKGGQEVELSYNEYPRGVNMAFPRQSFRDVGLFSTAFGLKGRSLRYYDEIELCYRLERLGRRILYTPDAEVDHAIHPERLTVAWFKQRFYSQGKTEAYFDLVHKGRRHVVGRLQQQSRLAREERDHLVEPGGDFYRLCRTWARLGYGVGAVHGWTTGVRRRARPAPYNGTSPWTQPARPTLAVTSTSTEAALEASIVIPSKNGGALFGLALERIFAQKTPWPFEVIVVDSGSSAESLEIVRRFPVRLHTIPPAEFNHGRTRDLGASLATGQHLVFLNQDAVPCSEDWLVTLLEPLRGGDEYAAVQGGILEFPDRPRFFWDSGGPRFYFTRESERWIPRHDGIGFSTVNAAIRRSAWEACPFGDAVIMEDKKWQRQMCARGGRIAYRPEAAVFHTHNYSLRQMIKRCQQEGFGWHLVGETYSIGDMLRDTVSMPKYEDLWRGLREGRVRTGAELLFPLLRPWLVFRGNRLLRKYPA